MKKNLKSLLMALALLVSYSLQVKAQAYVQNFNNHFNTNLGAYGNSSVLAQVGCRNSTLYTFQAGIYNFNTSMQVQSLSKLVTSAIIMMLDEENKLDIDDKVGEHIASWNSNGKENVTIRQLLAHSSGVVVESGYDDLSTMTLEQAVDAIAANTTLLFTPGTDWEYSSCAYKVASRVAEVVEGKLWKDIFAERVKNVVGMPNAVFSPGNINNPATGRGLNCSMNEYANFMKMILGYGMYNNTRIMDSTSIVTMEEESSHEGIITYGLGQWREEIVNGVAKEFYHTGASGCLEFYNRNKNYWGVIISSSDFNATYTINQNFRQMVRNELPSTECAATPSCDFNMGASATPSSVAPGGSVDLSYTCSGANCSGLTYAWSGNGISGNTTPKTITAPSVPGTYTYTITASKSGCTNKTANAYVTVTNTGGNPCGYVDKQNVGTWNGLNVQVRQYTVNGSSAWLIVTAVAGSSVDKHFPRGSNFADRTDISWSNGVINKACLGGGGTSWGGLSKPSGITTPAGYVAGTEPDGAEYFQQSCTPPAAPGLSASPSTVTSGSPSTLTASGCTGGTITWTGLGTGTQKTVNPTSTTTYKATCTLNGCTSSEASVVVTVDNSGTPFNQCLESELQTGTGAVTDDPNASNGYTRGEQNNYNHYVDYAITGVPSAGTYYVTLRYYSSAAPTISVTVNGSGAQTINLTNSGSWNIVWTTRQFSVTLPAGSSTLRISGTGGGSCRQDRICVSNSQGSPSVLEDQEGGAAQRKAFTVFPNPSKGVFTTDFYLEKGKKGTIVISDMQGRAIYRQYITGQGLHRERINLTGKASGMMLIQLQTDKGVQLQKINLAR